METDSDINTQQQESFNYDSIKPIDSNTVHRICSGQVVLSLAIAVKELVENAIDASATNIEVRLKEFGSELLEVSDNGSGIHKENFQALTLKHCTSKLRQFTDLGSVQTLGFRGEALSSLCALSQLTVTTRHASSEFATKISYDLNGKIVEEMPAAREVGTTVSLGKLFTGLPVRRKEFTKNLKREYSKMCQLLYAYCLVSKNIKFSCTNLTNGSKNTVISTEGPSSIRDNIINIFGPKQISSLMQLNVVEPSQEILDEYRVKFQPGEVLPVSFDCLISSASHGEGRSTNDRQFFYVNSRPCEPQKIMKLINSIYRQFNGNQYPFVYLNVIIERSLVDVNVTPDKRQVFVDNEKLLLAVLKSSLLDTFKNCPSTYTLQNVEIKGCGSVKGLKRSFNDSITELFKKHKSDSAIKKEKPKLFRQTSLITSGNVSVTKSKPVDNTESILVANTCDEGEVVKKGPNHVKSINDKVILDDECDLSATNLDELILLADEIQHNTQPDLMVTNTQVTLDTQPIIHNVDNGKLENYSEAPPKKLEKSTNLNLGRRTITIQSSMKYIKEALAATYKHNNSSEEITVNFHSQITPASNKTAETELQKQITKDKFKKMSIIGQFNLGFIIAQLENDLFIIDQHATDEKYNFEELQLNMSLDSQVLVNPKALELTAANEELLIENEEVFRKNGFSFLINRNAAATKKVSLTAIPMSKNYIFGKNDIEEMLFMLQEGINPAICRPSRVQLMFATRACRKSVMVGCPLSKSDMRRLIDHMGEIDQPWNCPHGRPTMRHLINLQLLQNK